MGTQHIVPERMHKLKKKVRFSLHFSDSNSVQLFPPACGGQRILTWKMQAIVQSISTQYHHPQTGPILTVQGFYLLYLTAAGSNFCY
jgi:hypothetical protein